MRMAFGEFLAAGLGMIAVSCAAAATDEIDPRGVFFHSYTGPSSAVEWIHIWQDEGDRRYTFSDIRGIAPYSGMIDPGGAIAWDTLPDRGGSGMFTSQDDATQTLEYQGGLYQSTLRRAPGTDADFITRIGSRESGDARVAGVWNVAIDTLDARTGDLLSTETTSAITTVTGDLLRITLNDGAYYQGVFETATTAGFRVIGAGGGVPPGFGSFEGSETSLSRDVLGDFRMIGEDSFSAVMLLQTRRRPGLQEQAVYRFTANRVPAPGGGIVLAGAMLPLARRRRPLTAPSASAGSAPA